MNDGKSRQTIRKFLPDEYEVTAALEAALRAEEASGATLTGPELVCPKAGSVVEAKVLGMQADAVRVDIGWKANGVIPLSEFPDQLPAVGSMLRVRVLRIEDANGEVSCSAEEARRYELIAELGAGRTGKVVQAKVIEAVKGGLVVDVGLRAFMPAKEADVRFVEDLSVFVGRTFDVRVIESNPAERRIVVSRRSLLEEERGRLREKLFTTLAPGQILDGVIVKILDFGVFVDIGGVEGLLHKGDMAWGRIAHPSEMVKEGDRVRVAVLNFDRQSGKISLGLKQTGPSPWDSVEVRYPVGSRHRGRVTGLLDFGAVVELESALSGMVHISELSWEKRVNKPADVVALGQEIEVEVVGIEAAKRRLSLSVKRIEANPHANLSQRFTFASIVEGTVSELLDFGAVIRTACGAEGLLHISEFSWTQRLKHPREMLAVGQKLTLIVLGVDEGKQRLTLSLKQTEPDPWWDADKDFAVGKHCTGKVLRLETFGAFVELRPGVDGLLHISRMGIERGAKPASAVKIGEVVNVEVVELELDARRIALALLPPTDDA
ncbi:MAG: S1 RNA-binding domain-containing protein [Planctomycetes bacterium]|nr:S1 RNA-binding domain-containing protein [Planctomycetota bacterium]